MSKKNLTERDICTKFITPVLKSAGWDIYTQILEELPLTKGRIIVLGKVCLLYRGHSKYIKNSNDQNYAKIIRECFKNISGDIVKFSLYRI